MQNTSKELSALQTRYWLFAASCAVLIVFYFSIDNGERYARAIDLIRELQGYELSEEEIDAAYAAQTTRTEQWIESELYPVLEALGIDRSARAEISFDFMREVGPPVLRFSGKLNAALREFSADTLTRKIHYTTPAAGNWRPALETAITEEISPAVVEELAFRSFDINCSSSYREICRFTITFIRPGYSDIRVEGALPHQNWRPAGESLMSLLERKYPDAAFIRKSPGDVYSNAHVEAFASFLEQYGDRDVSDVLASLIQEKAKKQAGNAVTVGQLALPAGLGQYAAPVIVAAFGWFLLMTARQALRLKPNRKDLTENAASFYYDEPLAAPVPWALMVGLPVFMAVMVWLRGHDREFPFFWNAAWVAASLALGLATALTLRKIMTDAKEPPPPPAPSREIPVAAEPHVAVARSLNPRKYRRADRHRSRGR